MHITDITFHRGAGLLRLCTDGAQEGWAAGATAAAAEAIDAVYRPLLLGGTPWERERLWQRLRQAGRAAGLPPSTWGLVDIALWDLLGKAQGLPVYRVIGGFRDRVPAYLRGTPGVGMEAAAHQALAARDAGFWGYGFAAAGRSHADLRQLRQAVGDEFRLLCDGAGLDLEGALALGRVLEEIDAHWFAEPLRDDDPTGLQQLADALDLPVVAGAFAGASLQLATRALSTRAVDRLRATLPTAGGITDVLKLARGAEALGLNCEIDWDRQGSPHAAAQLLAAVRNAEFFAADPADRPGHPALLPLALAGGELHLPAAPGLGVQLADPTSAV